MGTYCFKYCLSINHSNNNDEQNKHNHTVEVAVYIRYKDEQTQMVKFNDAEEIMKLCFEPYQGAYLNSMEIMEDNVTIEHLGEVLFFEVEKTLDENNIKVEKFEISETPLRTYIVARTQYKDI